MSYKIVYGEAFPAPQRRSPDRLQALTAACILIFALLVKANFPEGIDVLRQYLLPGELSQTQLALDDFMGQLQDGEPVGQAFAAFCHQLSPDDGHSA